MAKKKRAAKSPKRTKPSKTAVKKKSLSAAARKKTLLCEAVSGMPAGSRKEAVQEVREEITKQSQELFIQEGPLSFKGWVTRFSPVIISMIVGLATYFFLIFYLFYPQTMMYGHYMQLLILLTFIFFVVGVLIYLGIQVELMFIRIMSFAFVFIIFTFLLIFILLANAMYG